MRERGAARRFAGGLRWLGAQLWAIRTKLLLVNAVIVAVPLFGIGFARLYEREMLRSLETDMVHQAEVVRGLLDVESNPALTGQSKTLQRIARRTGARLRLIDRNGQIVSDSSGSPMPGRTVRTQREVRIALGGRYGAATRAGDGKAYLYSALPIHRDGKVIGAVSVQKSTLAVHRSMHRLRESLWKVLWWSLALTFVLTIFLAATISRPLSRLTRRAKRMAAGDRRVSTDTDRKDEIGDLARAVHEMASQLDARASGMARLASDISHEFKSPLTSLRGAAELLAGSAGERRESRVRFTSNIVRDVARLDRLVTQLSVLSRVDADGEPWRHVDLRALLASVVDDRFADRSVTIAGPSDVVVAQVRAAHIESAVSNLVDNALAYAEDDAVTIELSTGRDFASIDVRNRGPAIEADAIDRLWERFYTTRGGSGGTGLGLPIVATAARAHGGRVWASSDASAGTTFGFSIRLAA